MYADTLAFLTLTQNLILTLVLAHALQIIKSATPPRLSVTRNVGCGTPALTTNATTLTPAPRNSNPDANPSLDE